MIAETREALQAHESRMLAMAMVHELLYQSNSLSYIDLGMFIKKLSNSMVKIYRSEEQINGRIFGQTLNILPGSRTPST